MRKLRNGIIPLPSFYFFKPFSVFQPANLLSFNIMIAKKRFLIILGAIIFLGGCLWLFRGKPFTSKTLVVGSPQTDNNSAKTNPENDPEQNMLEDKIEIENENAEQDPVGSVQDPPDNPTNAQRLANPDQEDIEQSEPSFVEKRLISWGFQTARDRKIDTVIIHSSYDALGDDPYDVDGLLDEYRQYGVSAHYLIDREGTAYQLVEDKNIAYHAGASTVPDGRTNVNTFSIGIELMNTKKDKYTNDQYEKLNSLLDHLKSSYDIKYVLGHDDIAPDRKDDPWNFDWDKVEN